MRNKTKLLKLRKALSLLKQIGKTDMLFPNSFNHYVRMLESYKDDFKKKSL